MTSRLGTGISQNFVYSVRTVKRFPYLVSKGKAGLFCDFPGSEIMLKVSVRVRATVVCVCDCIALRKDFSEPLQQARILKPQP